MPNNRNYVCSGPQAHAFRIPIFVDGRSICPHCKSTATIAQTPGKRRREPHYLAEPRRRFK